MNKLGFGIYLARKTSSQPAVIWLQFPSSSTTTSTTFFLFFFLLFKKLIKFLFRKNFYGNWKSINRSAVLHCYLFKRHTTLLPFPNSPKSFFFYHPLFFQYIGFFTDISGLNRVCAVKCQASLVGQTMIVTGKLKMGISGSKVALTAENGTNLSHKICWADWVCG